MNSLIAWLGFGKLNSTARDTPVDATPLTRPTYREVLLRNIDLADHEAATIATYVVVPREGDAPPTASSRVVLAEV
jgi:hypothetical protein